MDQSQLTIEDIRLAIELYCGFVLVFSFLGSLFAVFVYDALISFFSFLRNKLFFASDEINKDQD